MRRRDAYGRIRDHGAAESLVGQRDGAAARMTAKRLLYRGFIAQEAIRARRSGASINR
jgi:hypothetical protein